MIASDQRSSREERSARSPSDELIRQPVSWRHAHKPMVRANSSTIGSTVPSRAATTSWRVAPVTLFVQLDNWLSTVARAGSISAHRRAANVRSVVQIRSCMLTSPATAKSVLRAKRRPTSLGASPPSMAARQRSAWRAMSPLNPRTAVGRVDSHRQDRHVAAPPGVRSSASRTRASRRTRRRLLPARPSTPPPRRPPGRLRRTAARARHRRRPRPLPQGRASADPRLTQARPPGPWRRLRTSRQRPARQRLPAHPGRRQDRFVADRHTAAADSGGDETRDGDALERIMTSLSLTSNHLDNLGLVAGVSGRGTTALLTGIAGCCRRYVSSGTTGGLSRSVCRYSRVRSVWVVSARARGDRWTSSVDRW